MPRSKTRDWEALKEECIKLYNEGEYLKNISKKININSHLINKWLKEEFPNNIGKFKNYRKNTFNFNYFSKIDSEDKAYFLGLIYADGNLYARRNRLQIFLQSQDKYILELFSKYIEHNGKLYNDRGIGFKLILDSKILYNDLLKLGLTPNKTFDIRFPDENILPKELQSHFIRGFFDGDGCISISSKTNVNINFTSNFMFINDIKNILLNNGIESTNFNKRYKEKEVSSGSISIGKKEYQKILEAYMYKNCKDLFLSRKKDKFKIIHIIKEIMYCKVCKDNYFAKGFCKKHYMKNYYERKKS